MHPFRTWAVQGWARHIVQLLDERRPFQHSAKMHGDENSSDAFVAAARIVDNDYFGDNLQILQFVHPSTSELQQGKHSERSTSQVEDVAMGSRTWGKAHCPPLAGAPVHFACHRSSQDTCAVAWRMDGQEEARFRACVSLQTDHH